MAIQNLLSSFQHGQKFSAVSLKSNIILNTICNQNNNKLLNSFVFSKLFHCSSVWGNTSKRNLHKLQLVQNFAARVVLGLKKFDHISQGWRSLKWLDVTEKVLFNDLVLVFKCVNGLAPDYLGKYFIKRSAVHNKNTRGCNNFVVP